MAQATHEHITSRFHNLSNAALADALGHADALLKGAEAECKSLKDEIKRRGLLAALPVLAVPAVAAARTSADDPIFTAIAEHKSRGRPAVLIIF